MSRPCPDGAVITLRGEIHFCDSMDSMAASSQNHDGWPHANRALQAIWTPAKDLPDPSDEDDVEGEQ